MPPLTRQVTPESVFSWWSDSNPLLVGNPIHTAAKPLTKFMHHRGVSSFIKHHRGIPLSGETIGIYSSYLGSKYVSDGTKTVILKELGERTMQFEAEALVLADSPWLYDVFLESSNDELRKQACILLGNVLLHDSADDTVLASAACVRLFTLLGDTKPDVVEGAIYAVSQVLRHPNGAQSFLESEVLTRDLVRQLLESTKPGVRKGACLILAALATHAPKVEAVLVSQPCEKLVSLLSDYDAAVCEAAIQALCQISTSPDGSKAVVDAAKLNVVQEFLKAGNSEVRSRTCRILGNIARHEHSAVTAITPTPCVQLVKLLRDADIGVVENAIYALAYFASRPNGASAVMDATVLNSAQELLKSPRTPVRKWTCLMLGNLAHHISSAAVFPFEFCLQLVTLLRDEDNDVAENAIYALSHIASEPERAEAVLSANALSFASQLLASHNNQLRSRTCFMLGTLAKQERFTVAVLAMEPCLQLATLLRDGDSDVVEHAIYSLSHLASSFNGANAVKDSGALQSAGKLLKSPESQIRRWTCLMVGHLARHKVTGDLLASELCGQLSRLLRGSDIHVVEYASYALSHIAYDLNGASAVEAASALTFATELLESKNSAVQRWTCLMLGEVARHKTLTVDALASDPCVQLVALLRRHDDIDVVENAIYALSHIAYSSQNGAKAVMDANALNIARGLLGSPRSQVRRWTCFMAGTLAQCIPSAAVPTSNLCLQLVKLLCDIDVDVVENATYALSHIAYDWNGANAVVDARALKFAPKLLQSSRSPIRKWMCLMVGNLARRISRAAVLASEFCLQLATLLCDSDIDVVETAYYALLHIASQRNGSATTDMIALKSVHELLETGTSEVRRWSCRFIGELAQGNFTVAVLASEPYVQLVQLLHDNDVDVAANAIYALSRMSQYPNRSKAQVDVGPLKVARQLLESENGEVRSVTCLLLGNLAGHENFTVATLASGLCVRLAMLLRDTDINVVENTIYILSQITYDRDAAEVVAGTKALKFTQGLLASGNSNIRRWTCLLLGELVRHKFTVAVLASEPCLQLAALLRDSDIAVVETALYTLSYIADDWNGAAAITGTSTLKFASELFESKNSEVQRWIASLLENLAKHKHSLVGVRASELCGPLVTFLANPHIDVVGHAIRALCDFAVGHEGSGAVIDAGVLQFTRELLESGSSEVRKWTCCLLGNIAQHDDYDFMDALLDSKPCVQLVTLLRDGDIDVSTNAIYALSNITSHGKEAGTKAVIDANALKFAEDLLELGSSDERYWTRLMLENLTKHEPRGVDFMHQLSGSRNDEVREWAYRELHDPPVLLLATYQPSS